MALLGMWDLGIGDVEAELSRLVLNYMKCLTNF